MCSIGSLQQRISDWVIALVRPLFFLICCTTLSAPGLRSLWTLLLTDKERVWSFFFPSQQLSRITPSQKSSLEVVRQKYLFFDPLSLVRMWLTPSPCGRPHIALHVDTTLWSCSVKLVLRKYAAHWAHYHDMQLKANTWSTESSYKQPHTGTQTYVGLLVSTYIMFSCTKLIVQDE